MYYYWCGLIIEDWSCLCVLPHGEAIQKKCLSSTLYLRKKRKITFYPAFTKEKFIFYSTLTEEKFILYSTFTEEKFIFYHPFTKEKFIFSPAFTEEKLSSILYLRKKVSLLPCIYGRNVILYLAFTGEMLSSTLHLRK